MHQIKGDGDIRVTLGTLVGDTEENQFALSNALVWATRALVVLAQGTLTNRTQVDEGTLRVFFGVYAWAPTLPDPYVGNFRVCRPEVKSPRALLSALVTWGSTIKVVTKFSGLLGPPIVCDKPETANGRPEPSKQWDLKADVGLTQSEQDSHYLDEEQEADRKAAQKQEQGDRIKRAAQAKKKNLASEAAIAGYLEKMLGQTPPVLLLDVSTNQDLLGVALWGAKAQNQRPATVAAAAPTHLLGFPVQALQVRSSMEARKFSGSRCARSIRTRTF
jgi:hypothetical protein